ncbi:hypothetical protein BGW80DRAFT_1462172 [Lactifluus volemus]|nr:hypothetical protein BGW80DRAFT_1462172 [Lactifluus volemus]
MLPVLPRWAHVNRPLPTHMHYIRSSQSTPKQFYDRLALIVSRCSETRKRWCRKLVGRIDQVDTEVASMLDKWKSVEEGGKRLQDASQKLLDERDQLVELQTAIGTTLEYFQELEHPTRLLNHHGESLVLQTDFLYMVERVDICIEFLKSHKQKSTSYASSDDVSRRLFEQDVSESDTAQMHLLYTRFATVAGQLAHLLGEFERRAHSHPEELGVLLSECHVAYFGARKNFLVSRLTEQIRGLDPTRTELVELTRAGCSYLKQIYTEEIDMYRAFFSTGKQELLVRTIAWNRFVITSTMTCAPASLHEPRLTVLCEENEEKNDDLCRLHIRHLLQMIPQDTQTRPFFKAQAVRQSDIRHYTPTARDLAYPDKLATAQGAQTGYEIREKQSISRLFEGPGLNQREAWYPTLSKTPTVFYDLAHEGVRQEITRNLGLVQKDEPQAGGGGGAADQYGVAYMLSSVLLHTSRLLPGSLFTSLFGMRAEHLADAR